MGDTKQHVDTNPTDFKQDPETGPNTESLSREPSPPLFLSDSSEGKKGNPQDEKDETEE